MLASPQVADIKKEPEPEPDEADDIAGALMRALAGRAKKVVIDSGACRRAPARLVWLASAAALTGGRGRQSERVERAAADEEEDDDTGDDWE